MLKQNNKKKQKPVYNYNKNRAPGTWYGFIVGTRLGLTSLKEDLMRGHFWFTWFECHEDWKY